MVRVAPESVPKMVELFGNLTDWSERTLRGGGDLALLYREARELATDASTDARIEVVEAISQVLGTAGYGQLTGRVTRALLTVNPSARELLGELFWVAGPLQSRRHNAQLDGLATRLERFLNLESMPSDLAALVKARDLFQQQWGQLLAADAPTHFSRGQALRQLLIEEPPVVPHWTKRSVFITGADVQLASGPALGPALGTAYLTAQPITLLWTLDDLFHLRRPTDTFQTVNIITDHWGPTGIFTGNLRGDGKGGLRGQSGQGFLYFGSVMGAIGPVLAVVALNPENGALFLKGIGSVGGATVGGFVVLSTPAQEYLARPTARVLRAVANRTLSTVEHVRAKLAPVAHPKEI